MSTRDQEPSRWQLFCELLSDLAPLGRLLVALVIVGAVLYAVSGNSCRDKCTILGMRHHGVDSVCVCAPHSLPRCNADKREVCRP